MRGPTLEQVASFSSLWRAFTRARKAKRGRGQEPAFYRALEDKLLALGDALRERTWRPDPYRYFVLARPKRRVVSEASFRDRVVHHALVGALEPVFEGRFIRHSYACRIGGGQHAAVQRVRALVRRRPYFLRLDIQRYFDNIHHDILMELLGAEIAEEGLRWLCHRLLEGARVPTVPRSAARGLPIGNLTSQFWANVYLDPLDHFVTDELGRGSYARYMDDMVVLGRDKASLWRVKEEIDHFLEQVLRLKLKPAVVCVAPVTEGVPWLGLRIFPGLVRLRAPARRRLAQQLRVSARWAEHGDQEREASVALSLCGHAALADSRMLLMDITEQLEDTWPFEPMWQQALTRPPGKPQSRA